MVHINWFDVNEKDLFEMVWCNEEEPLWNFLCKWRGSLWNVDVIINDPYEMIWYK